MALGVVSHLSGMGSIGSLVLSKTVEAVGGLERELCGQSVSSAYSTLSKLVLVPFFRRLY